MNFKNSPQKKQTKFVEDFKILTLDMGSIPITSTFKLKS